MKKLLDSIGYQFVKIHIGNERRRKRLLGVWVSMADFMTYPWQFKQLIAKNKIPIDLFYGRYDTIIRAKEGKRLAKDLPNCHFYSIESGHNLINEKLDLKLKVLL